MCSFIEGSHLMPGAGCCRCDGYNGLQRKACKFCREPICEVEVPEGIQRCSTCGFGARMAMELNQQNCPSCHHDRVMAAANN